MTQRGIVRRRLGPDRVEISVKRASACSHNCADCAGCETMIHSPDVTAVAQDDFGTRVGQRVTVESASGPILWYAFLLYLLPFVGLFLAAALLGNYGEGIAAGGAVAAFLVVLLGVSLPLERYLRRHKTVTCRVIAVEE